jgi:hypothetical protein
MPAVPDVLAEEPLDDLEGLAQAGIDVDGADHRLGHVAKDGFLLCAAGTGLGISKVEFAAELELAGDGGAGFLAHQCIERAAQLALVGARHSAEQDVGDHEAKHAVAEEFEPLVGTLDALRRRHGARMGERAVEQVWIGKAVAEPGLEPVVRPASGHQL